jgi:hypothetical protein
MRKYSFDIDRSKIGIVGPRIASFIDELRYDIQTNLRQFMEELVLLGYMLYIDH